MSIRRIIAIALASSAIAVTSLAGGFALAGSEGDDVFFACARNDKVIEEHTSEPCPRLLGRERAGAVERDRPGRSCGRAGSAGRAGAAGGPRHPGRAGHSRASADSRGSRGRRASRASRVSRVRRASRGRRVIRERVGRSLLHADGHLTLLAHGLTDDGQVGLSCDLNSRAMGPLGSETFYAPGPVQTPR